MVKAVDNLKIGGGVIEGRMKDQWAVANGERAEPIRYKDNLNVEGSMEGRYSDDWKGGEKAVPIKYQDNLIIEGAMEDRIRETWIPGERANTVKKEDSLKLDGGAIEIYKKEWATNGERAVPIRYNDNLLVEGSMESRSSQNW